MFTIKICGVIRPEDGQAVATCGADAVGLNFYPASRRFISEEAVAPLLTVIGERIQKVGVFVNEPIGEIERRVNRFKLDWVQLHGHESPRFVLELQGMTKVLKAFRYGATGLTDVVDYLYACRQLGGSPDAILLDAAHADLYGGTGQTLNWKRLRTELTKLPNELPWVLAGGLTPSNVGQAVRQLQPSAVDTASGVESAPGVKDTQMIAAFVEQAHSARRV